MVETHGNRALIYAYEVMAGYRGAGSFVTKASVLATFTQAAARHAGFIERSPHFANDGMPMGQRVIVNHFDDNS